MDYAIIKLGGKQHRVRDGETLVVDRLRVDVGGTIEPDVLLGDGTKVVVTVIAHERGPKIRIGKYRRRTGYKRHNGFRAATSRVEVALGAPKKRAAKKAAPKPAEEAAVEAAEVEAPEAEAIEATEAATEVEAHEAEAPEAEAPEAEPLPPGLPEGYAEMTVAEIGKEAKGWDRTQLEAARTYEEAHAARKGALTAIDAALAAGEEEEG
jgi:large subunit ribosomal protein L21